MKPRTTGSATSASSSAMRISRAVASMSASESRPLPRRLARAPQRRSERVSNTCPAYLCQAAVVELHPIEVHIVDGTYELFRYHFSPNNKDPKLGATRGVLGSLVQLVDDGATHVGVATDQVIESFRNDLWAGYKSSAGMPQELLAQFPLVERVLAAAGFTVWPQVEHEADDGMAAAAALAAADERVSRVRALRGPRRHNRGDGGQPVKTLTERLHFGLGGPARDQHFQQSCNEVHSQSIGGGPNFSWMERVCCPMTSHRLVP